MQILAIKDRLGDLGPERHDRVVDYLLSLQNPASGLCWGDVTRLEEDNRFLYCSINALAHMGELERLDREKAINGVLSCLNFDGGFGRVRGAESHAAQGEYEQRPLKARHSLMCSILALYYSAAFTSVGVLTVLEALDRLDHVKVATWLSERQLPNGGLNGRPEKLEDVCYSWWVLTALSMLDKLHWIDAAKLRAFILSAQVRLDHRRDTKALD